MVQPPGAGRRSVSLSASLSGLRCSPRRRLPELHPGSSEAQERGRLVPVATAVQRTPAHRLFHPSRPQLCRSGSARGLSGGSGGAGAGPPRALGRPLSRLIGELAEGAEGVRDQREQTDNAFVHCLSAQHKSAAASAMPDAQLAPRLQCPA